MTNVYAARAAKNFYDEASVFYFIFDPAGVPDYFKTKLDNSTMEPNGPCSHLKNKDVKYQIKECCWVAPSKGEPTVEEDVSSGRYSRNYAFEMFSKELFIEEPWTEEIRGWIYDTAMDTPVCHFRNDSYYFTRTVRNII